MNSRSYIRLTGNLTCGGIITGTTACTTITASSVPIRTKTVCIGPWQMNLCCSQLTKVVSSGVAYNKIRNVDALIKSDTGEMFHLEKNSGNWEVSGYIKVCCCPTNDAEIELGHNNWCGSFFRSGGFDNTLINRGCVIIDYSIISATTLTTGNACNVGCATMDVCGNIINADGNSPITEFGVVYSQSTYTPTYSDCKVCTIGSISLNTPYCKQITGLADGACTHFRAYARNCEEIGYGSVKHQCTCTLPLPSAVTVNYVCQQDWGNQTCGCLDVSPALGLGQSFCLTMYFDQCAITMGDLAQITVCCQTCGTFGWCDISNCIDPTNCLCAYGSFGSCSNNGGGLFCVNRGDKICFKNCGIYNSGTYSCFTLYPNTCVGVDVCIGACSYNCAGS
jgi:hypothetical protein